MGDNRHIFKHCLNRQIVEPVLPIVSLIPEQKGSVLDTLILICM